MAEYRVEEDGGVWSYYANKYITPRDNGNGYLQLGINGKKKYVHRLVAEKFIPNPHNLPDVNHLDGIKHHNHKDNLEWCSRGHNVRHSLEMGMSKPTNNIPVYQYTKSGVFIAKHDSVLSANRAIGKPSTAKGIYDCFRKRANAAKSAYGFKWKKI